MQSLGRMRDIVTGNLVSEAEQLGYKEIIIVGKPTKIESTMKVSFAYIVGDKDYSKLSKIRKNYDYLIGKGDRKAFENKHIEFILPDMEISKDHTHYRNSGMDQILAKIAKTKKKTILFDLSLIRKSKNRQQILGRMMQNARLCKKYKVPFEFVTFAGNNLELKTPKDLKALSRVLT